MAWPIYTLEQRAAVIAIPSLHSMLARESLFGCDTRTMTPPSRTASLAADQSAEAGAAKRPR